MQVWILDRVLSSSFSLTLISNTTCSRITMSHGVYISTSKRRYVITHRIFINDSEQQLHAVFSMAEYQHPFSMTENSVYFRLAFYFHFVQRRGYTRLIWIDK